MTAETVSVRPRELRAVVSPSPFDGSGAEVPAAVSFASGQLTLTDGERTVAVRPVRAVIGHGTLHVTTAEPRRRLRLVFERYDVAAVTRQHYSSLHKFYRRLDTSGFRDLLVALRAHGVPLAVAPRVRRGAGAHRATGWVSAYALLFVELGLFGIPASTIGALASGAYATSSTVVTVGLMVGLGCFLLIAATTSPIPTLIRQQFGFGSARDPIRYFDAWAGRTPAADPGLQPTFVPGVPVLHTAFLLVACAIYPWLTRNFVAELDPPGDSAAPPGEVYVPVPSWLDGEAVSLLGYAATGLLLAVFVISLIRSRREPELHSIRWAAPVGAFFCFAFGQAGADLQFDNGLEAWLPVAAILMFVAFTTTRVAVGFAVFTAMVLLALLGAFGAFSDASALHLLVPVAVLLGAIAARYFPGGAKLVPLPRDQAARVKRLVWTLWAVAVALGIGLAVAAANLVQLG